MLNERMTSAWCYGFFGRWDKDGFDELRGLCLPRILWLVLWGCGAGAVAGPRHRRF